MVYSYNGIFRGIEKQMTDTLVWIHQKHNAESKKPAQKSPYCSSAYKTWCMGLETISMISFG